MVTALLETAIGVALLVSPAMPVWQLLGVGLDTPGGWAAGRIAGAALLSLGIACWLGRRDPQNHGLVAAMLVYNISVVVVLIDAGLGLTVRGIALWPAISLHTALAVWCLVVLRSAVTCRAT